MESPHFLPHVWTYSRSYEGARDPKRRPNASNRGQRPQNNPPQEVERGAPGRTNILVKVYGVQLRNVFPLDVELNRN